MKILIAGDFCPQNRVEKAFSLGDYASVLNEVKPIVEKADYSIVNFECPVCYGGEKPIEKCGPNLKCSERGIEAIKWAGFKCVTLANNHFLDYGEEGVNNTLVACEKAGIDTVGGGKNLEEASRILYKTINGQTLAIINCCEHEFSIATDTTAGSNPLNPVNQYYTIKEAKANSDIVIVIVHGGIELFQIPTPRMQQTYRFFIDAGADVVINHHQHCYSGYELHHDKYIIYGLGNFSFDRKGQSNKKWTEGYMVEIDLQENISIELIPYTQGTDNFAGINLMAAQEKEISNIEVQKINKIISNQIELKNKYESYLNKTDIFYKNLISPYSKKITSGLYVRNILPSFISRKKWLSIYDRLICESHYERILHMIKKYHL